MISDQRVSSSLLSHRLVPPLATRLYKHLRSEASLTPRQSAEPLTEPRRRVFRDRTALRSAMFSALRSALSPVERVRPSSWDPSSPIPSGSASRNIILTSRINERSHLKIKAEGSWSHGTLRYKVEGSGQAQGSSSTEAADNAQLPSYQEAVLNLAVLDRARTAAQEKKEGGQFAEGEGELMVHVEARWNDEKLWDESSVTLATSGSDIVLLVKTPTMSPGRLMSQLSFHITLIFPSRLPSLAAVTAAASQWRHLGAPSFGSLLIRQAHIGTTNAPLAFELLRATEMRLSCSNSEISGRYEAGEEGLEIKADNTSISGSFLAPSRVAISTNNCAVDAQITAGELSVKNSNGKILGSFEAKSSLSLETSNQNLEWTSLKMRRVGTLRLKTVNGAIKGRVELLDFEVEGAESESDQALAFADEKKRAPASTARNELGRAKGNFSGSARSANGAISLSLAGAGCEAFALPDGEKRGIFTFEASSPNGNVSLEVPTPWDSLFSLHTSNANANIEAPASHGAFFDKQERTKVEGWLSSEDGRVRTASKITLSSSNSDVSLKVVDAQSGL